MLVDRIGSALNQLNEYERKLEEELAQRAQINLGLRAYRTALQESIRTTRSCIEVK